ncbi:MAG: pilin [Pedobacter sp.]|jgi:hypothetical protein
MKKFSIFQPKTNLPKEADNFSAQNGSVELGGQFSKPKLKNNFVKILTLFFSIIFALGLIFISANQIKAEGEDCNSSLPCEGDDEVCVGATDDEFGECRVPDDAGGDEADVGGYCSSASDCQSGLECQRNSCMLPDNNDGGGDMCTDDSDCTGDLECVSGTCMTVDSSPRSSGGGGVTFENPLSADTIPELVSTVLSVVLGFIGILAVASLVYGGVLYMTAGSNEDQANKAKKVLGYSVMGLVVSILSYVIVSTVINIIKG